MLRRPANTDIDLSHIFPVFEHSDEGAHAFADATFGTVLPCNGALHAHVHQLRHPGGADHRTRLHRKFWAEQQKKLNAEIAEEEAKRAKRAKKKARKKRGQEQRRAQREMDAFERVPQISDANLKHHYQ